MGSADQGERGERGLSQRDKVAQQAGSGAHKGGRQREAGETMVNTTVVARGIPCSKASPATRSRPLAPAS